MKDMTDKARETLEFISHMIDDRLKRFPNGYLKEEWRQFEVNEFELKALNRAKILIEKEILTGSAGQNNEV